MSDGIDVIVGEKIKVGDLAGIGGNGKLLKKVAAQGAALCAPIDLLEGDRISYDPYNGQVLSIVRDGDEIYHDSNVKGADL